VGAGADVNARTTTGATPLMLAAASGSADAVAILVELTADPNAIESANGQTALMFASAADRADAVRALGQHGADTKIASKTVDISRATPPEEVLQQQIRDQENAKSAAATPGGGPAPARRADSGVAGVTRPYTFNELIGQQGGLTALHFAAR